MVESETEQRLQTTPAMPELPEVEVLRRQLRRALGDARLADMRIYERRLRFPLSESFADTALTRDRRGTPRLEDIRRRGKYLLFHLSGGRVLLCHLGMSGQLLLEDSSQLEPRRHCHEHLAFLFRRRAGRGGSRTRAVRLGFRDTRRFGFWDIARADELSEHPRLRGLGIEPFDAGFGGSFLVGAFAGRRVSVKSALLDQRIVAGVGNIYASEALFRARISPMVCAGDLTARRCGRLAAGIVSVLEDAIAAGGSTRRDYVHSDGGGGYFQHRWSVYGRAGEPCPGCRCRLAETGGIQKSLQSGRSTFYCPTKQKA